MEGKPIAAGKSSFQKIDSEKLFSELQLREGMTFLDIACGRGDYSIAASKTIGDRGIIHAVDHWKEGIAHLKKELAQKKIRNIYPAVVDVSRHIPIEKGSVDVCLMAMVLHDLFRDGTGEGTLKEVQRVMKPKGILALIEFKKIAGPPGPPIDDKISSEELEAILTPYGFRIKKTTDMGTTRYLSIFIKKNIPVISPPELCILNSCTLSGER